MDSKIVSSVSSNLPLPSVIRIKDWQTFKMLGNYKNLDSLFIDGYFIFSSEDIATLISAISNMKNLTHLKVKDGLSNDGIITLLKSGHLKNLKELEFIANKNIQYNEAEVRKAIDEGCPNLKILKLSL